MAAGQTRAPGVGRIIMKEFCLERQYATSCPEKMPARIFKTEMGAGRYFPFLRPVPTSVLPSSPSGARKHPFHNWSYKKEKRGQENICQLTSKGSQEVDGLFRQAWIHL